MRRSPQLSPRNILAEEVVLVLCIGTEVCKVLGYGSRNVRQIDRVGHDLDIDLPYAISALVYLPENRIFDKTICAY